MSREGDIEIRFGGGVYRGNYLDDLHVDERHINDVLDRHPARYVFWAKMASMTRVLWEKEKQDLERYEAQCYSFIRQQMIQQGDRPTESMINAKVRLDPRRQELQTSILRAKLQLDHLTSIKDAFSMRTHSLMSISANLREEWEHSMSVRIRTPNGLSSLQARANRETFIPPQSEIDVGEAEKPPVGAPEEFGTRPTVIGKEERVDSRAEALRREFRK